jgi:hypothetical protein
MFDSKSDEGGSSTAAFYKNFNYLASAKFETISGEKYNIQLSASSDTEIVQSSFNSNIFFSQVL